MDGIKGSSGVHHTNTCDSTRGACASTNSKVSRLCKMLFDFIKTVGEMLLNFPSTIRKIVKHKKTETAAKVDEVAFRGIGTTQEPQDLKLFLMERLELAEASIGSRNENIPDQVRKDRDAIEEFTRQIPPYLDTHMKANYPDRIVEAIKKNPTVYLHVIENNLFEKLLPKDKRREAEEQIHLAAVEADPSFLEKVPDHFKSNREFLVQALRLNWEAFEYLPDEDKNDPEFQWVAVSEFGAFRKHQPSDAKSHYLEGWLTEKRAVEILSYPKKSFESSCFKSKGDLKNITSVIWGIHKKEITFIEEAVKTDGLFFIYPNQEYSDSNWDRADIEKYFHLAEKAVENDYKALGILSATLFMISDQHVNFQDFKKKYIQVAIKAVKQNNLAFKYVSPTLSEKEIAEIRKELPVEEDKTSKPTRSQLINDYIIRGSTGKSEEIEKFLDLVLEEAREKIDPDLLQYLSAELLLFQDAERIVSLQKKYLKFAFMAVKKSPDTLCYISSELDEQSKKILVTKAFAAAKAKNFKKLVKTSVKPNPNSILPTSVLYRYADGLLSRENINAIITKIKQKRDARVKARKMLRRAQSLDLDLSILQ